MIPARLQAERLARLPKPEFDPALPVNARREDIRAAIEAHQVIIVCGETGSGKTTQLPKILLEMQRGVKGWIGHTQPRRIAARSVAARIAQELKAELGNQVGYKVRFNDKVRRESYVKLMTDGILLAETQGDPLLEAYDTIIIDEAHERSLNIDFLLGYLRQILPRRPDLKVIITSATIDAEKFARHFNGAPVIEVSGRLYPVEVRYRPVEGDAEDTTRDEEEAALVDAVEELCNTGPGDILVFLPGEREIRTAADILGRNLKAGSRSSAEILTLFSRLSAAEQDRVFRLGSQRRIVLATNVAETSLTVPGIRYVIDTGYARVKRYSYRNKVEQLQVEKISRASAAQRAGRCGRVSDGICIRLYDEDDFKKRPEFTDPEVLRSSLASVILRAKSLHLGDPAEFPFVDPPAPRAIADGYALLLADSSYTINAAYFKQKRYDAQKSFVPVSLIADTPYLLLVHPAVAALNVNEFIALAKAQPGKINLGSAGSGSGSHLIGALMVLKSGARLNHIPYKGSGPATADVVAGQIQSTFATAPGAMAFIKAGRLKALVLASAKRSASLPEVPTFSESGFKDILVTNWYGVVAPIGTAPAAVQRLYNEIGRAIVLPDVRERLASTALEPIVPAPGQFEQLIDLELKRWAAVIRDANIPTE